MMKVVDGLINDNNIIVVPFGAQDLPEGNFISGTISKENFESLFPDIASMEIPVDVENLGLNKLWLLTFREWKNRGLI